MAYCYQIGKTLSNTWGADLSKDQTPDDFEGVGVWVRVEQQMHERTLSYNVKDIWERVKMD